MKDATQFFVMIGVVALCNFQTSMTLWREYRKGTETVIKHIDERCAAIAQGFGGSNATCGAESNKAVNEGAYQIPEWSWDCFNDANYFFHGMNTKILSENKSTYERKPAEEEAK